MMITKNNTVTGDSKSLSVKETNRRILDQDEQWAMGDGTHPGKGQKIFRRKAKVQTVPEITITSIKGQTTGAIFLPSRS